MRRSLLWVSSSILITALIALFANLLSPSEAVKNAGANLLDFDLLPSYNWDADTAAEVGLTVDVPEQSEMLSYSSQAEVFEFVLYANGPFTLRYLTLNVQTQGLKPITGWTVYPLTDGAVDYQSPAAVSEIYHGDLVRFRFSSSASSAYLVQPGENHFMVVASVLKDPAATVSPELSIGFPDALTEEWNWAWLPGHHDEAWLQLGEGLGAEEVEGLPADRVRLH